jgi:hypothetical protein
MARDVEYFFMCFLPIWTSSFEKLIAHFFTGSLVFWKFSFFELLMYSGYQTLVGCTVGKAFLPFCGQPLQFREHFFCCAEALISVSPISILSLSC